MGLRYYTCAICVLWILSLCSAGEEDYGTNITHVYGKLSPPHDLLLEYGNEALNSTCTITNSSVPVTRKNRISFKLGKILINDSMVERLDNRSARVVILKPEMTKSDTYLTCELDDKIVDIKYLVVGKKPQDIQDFKCIGYNFVNMTCTWKREMTTNYDVQYSLWYRLKHVAGNFSCQSLEEKMIDGVETMSCFWNMSTTPQIRLTHNHIYFTVTGTNKKGSITKEFHIEQHEIMKSEAPINLTVLRVKPRSMMLHWEIPFDLTMMRDRSIQYRVMVTCEYWNMTSFKQVAVFSRNSTYQYIKYNLTDLPYANTLYDIRVGIKISKYDTEEMWSTNSSVTNYTASLIPASAPAASRTGFYFSSDDGIVTIYWTQLDKRFRNGPNFEYVITPFQNGTPISLPVRTRSNAHVQYENISNSAHYKFKIESKNSVGKSKNASYVVVPPKRRVTLRMAKPVQTEYSDVLYQLSWEPPTADDKLLTNYTVYWCIAQKEAASHLCDGILRFETVPKTTLRYNVTIPKNTNVQLAVSANGEKQSTGMVWAGCRIHHTTVQHKIQKIWVDSVTNTSIKLRWELLCEHKTGNIKGYFIEYCPTNSTGLGCVAEDMKNYTLPEANHDSVNITGLEPYTSYQLRVYTIDGVGSFSQSSDWKVNTTYDGTPTAPFGLNVTGTTNTTISIEWFEPLKKNGIVLNYKIYYNDEEDTMNNTVDTTQPVAEEKVRFNLTGLDSYQDYNISVAACVRSMCSDRSKFVTASTPIGTPGPIEKIKFLPDEKTLSWEPPSKKNGKIDYYEVKLRRNNEDEDQAQIKKMNGSSYVLVECEDGRIFYQVRAVNEMGNQRFYGEWTSKDKSESCHVEIKSISPALVVPFVIIFGLIMLGISVVAYKFLVRYFRRMKDVQYVVPNGLNGKSPLKNRLPPTDPQCLLDPKEPDHDLHHNGSSGFNSAHDSSSSESGESISSRTTDSGTGQRNTDNDFPMQHLKDIDTYQPLSKSSSGGNYVTVFGVKPEAETKNGALSDNVSSDDRSQMPSKMNFGEEQSPPVKKPVNTGYTPVEPTPSYVMAMPPCSESKGYVPSADLHKFMEPIVLPSFRMSLPSTTFPNDNGNDKGYVHATYDGDITSNFDSPKDSPPQVFKVSPGYVSCADSTAQPVVPEEPSSSAYVMHKQLEHVLPNN